MNLIKYEIFKNKAAFWAKGKNEMGFRKMPERKENRRKREENDVF